MLYLDLEHTCLCSHPLNCPYPKMCALGVDTYKTWSTTPAIVDCTRPGHLNQGGTISIPLSKSLDLGQGESVSLSEWKSNRWQEKTDVLVGLRS